MLTAKMIKKVNHASKDTVWHQQLQEPVLPASPPHA